VLAFDFFWLGSDRGGVAGAAESRRDGGRHEREGVSFRPLPAPVDRGFEFWCAD
jgi:hypothetical protein